MKGMSTKTSKPLPKWFDGTVYTEGDTVSNPYTGDKAKLSAEFTRNYKILEKGLDWFRKANAEAYMTLLDQL